eukprot:COSAG06_NODE_320_length_17586_cov_9.121347_16_plen_63_part_00
MHGLGAAGDDRGAAGREIESAANRSRGNHESRAIFFVAQQRQAPMEVEAQARWLRPDAAALT